jgi:hypothetical protein
LRKVTLANHLSVGVAGRHAAEAVNLFLLLSLARHVHRHRKKGNLEEKVERDANCGKPAE